MKGLFCWSRAWPTYDCSRVPLRDGGLLQRKELTERRQDRDGEQCRVDVQRVQVLESAKLAVAGRGPEVLVSPRPSMMRLEQ